MISIFPAIILIKHLDCQNAANPAVLHNSLESKVSPEVVLK